MKRFFKKASLVLVALCLIVGSTLPSFAALVQYSGAYTFNESNYLDKGDGTTVSCYIYVCYTGTYDNVDINSGRGNVAMRAECRGGNLNTHLTFPVNPVVY